MNPARPRPLKLVLLGLLVGIAALAACGDDGGGSEVVTIPFAAMVGDQPFSCSDGTEARTYDNLGLQGSTASFKDFRIYVSNVRLIDTAGAAVPVMLEPSSFQFEDVALLDFEDGRGGCVDLGNAAVNDVITGTVPAGDYQGLAFEVGVPFDKNHLDASAQDTPAPLNIMAMYWNWQGGHKFARIDLDVEGADGWNMHLGSTGCVSDGPMEAPTTSCGKPNVAEITLENFDPTSDTITIDAAELFADSDLTANIDGPPGCQSFPLDADDCSDLFPNLGLSFASGGCDADCAGQTVFYKE